MSRLRVNFIACDAYGACAELFPEWIELDDWGYPIVKGDEIPRDQLTHARRADQACPKVALVLVEDE